jgi:hypothetical protein
MTNGFVATIVTPGCFAACVDVVIGRSIKTKKKKIVRLRNTKGLLCNCVKMCVYAFIFQLQIQHTNNAFYINKSTLGSQ